MMKPMVRLVLATYIPSNCIVTMAHIKGHQHRTSTVIPGVKV